MTLLVKLRLENKAEGLTPLSEPVVEPVAGSGVGETGLAGSLGEPPAAPVGAASVGAEEKTVQNQTLQKTTFPTHHLRPHLPLHLQLPLCPTP